MIRKGKLSDAPAIAACLLLAMDDIVSEFIGQNDSEAIEEFMRSLVASPANQYSYENAWVVEREGRVVAAAIVYDGAHLERLRKPVAQYVESRYHLDFRPENETGPGEFYVDSIGVDPAFQGRGIGTALLRFLCEEFVEKRGEPLGLLVDQQNPAAKSLYLTIGFAKVGEQRLVGKTMDHLQLRPV
jgi:ribosomal protein S18 acetylase RimI-like enzyme